MIIECKNCLKKFTVRDSDIPIKGRIVQCSNCSSQWLQMRTTGTSRNDNLYASKKLSKISPSLDISKDSESDNLVIEKNISKDELIASDGKKYKFLGNQWAEVLPTGKSGKLARKVISKELNKLAGREKTKKREKISKINQSSNQYQEVTEKGMGLFSFLIVSILSIAAIILALDTFKNQLIPFFPDLDNYLVYIFETLNNIYIIIKDFFNNYK